jgi:hypothetical protein
MIPPMMPVNLSMSGLAALAGTSLEDTRPAEGTIPQNAGELTHTEQESYELHGDVAAKLGFPVFSINIADRYTVVAFVVSRFVDVPAKDGSSVHRYGVAIRALLEIYSTNIDGDLTAATIAAQAQLGRISARAQLAVHGYCGDLSSELPVWESFNVDAYAGYMTAVSNLQRSVLGDSQNIKPVLIGSTLASTIQATTAHDAAGNTDDGAAPATDKSDFGPTKRRLAAFMARIDRHTAQSAQQQTTP